jgi:ribosomal protein S18 acetylase RimI-like enzyme
MPALERITPGRFSDYKEIRLRALLDSPIAFGSTYTSASQLSDADWLKRATDLSSDRSVGYLAMERGIACGVAAAFLDECDPLKAHLISMWVAPSYRRSGIGRLLIDAIDTWVRAQGAHTLLLAVTSSNNSAIEFYKRNGFSMTGNTEPYPNDPTLIEFQMSRSTVTI